MKDISPRLPTMTATKLWLCAEVACLAFLACLLLGKGVLPGWHRLNSDFPNYYLVARLLREGYSLDRIYDWVWLQRIKDHWGLDQSLVAFAGLTPLSALPILPVAGFAALTAKRFWIVANLLFLFGTAETMHRVTNLGRRRVWILSLLAFIPLRASFLLGQMHILVLLLLALAYFFRIRRQPVACGICVALAGALKVYPLLFVFYFAWKKQWREVFSTACATAALVGIGYACMSSHLMHIYLTQILPRSMQGEVIDPYNFRAASAAAFLHRLFLFEPDLNPAPVWNRRVLYSIFYPLWQAAVLFPLFLSIRPSSNDRDTEKLEWAIFLFALLMLSPVPSSYHFVVMILPMVLAADVLVKRQQYDRLAVVILLYYIICGVTIPAARVGVGFSFFTVLAFARLWTGLLLWLFLVICLWGRNELPESRRALGLRAFALDAIVSIFWIAGFAGYQQHFAHLEEDIHARLRLPIHPPLATGLHPRAGGFVATMMTPVGYQIADQNGQAVLPSATAGTDQLSSAAAADRASVFVEVADENGSRIVLRDAPAVQIANAESPALSDDGAELAYIREEKGRGSLRMARLVSSSGTLAVTGDAEVVEGPYDVRDTSFAPSGYIVFSARVGGQTSIYKVRPGGTPSILVSGKEEVESGAVSPTGQWIVFRELLGNRWQLVRMDLASRQERQLTFGDCNAFAPAWMNATTVGYGTDCGRGLGLPALASINAGR
jgi:Glycosyltransferase family 87